MRGYSVALSEKAGELAMHLAAPGFSRGGRAVSGEDRKAACILLLIIPTYVNHANVLSDNSPSQLMI